MKEIWYSLHTFFGNPTLHWYDDSRLAEIDFEVNNLEQWHPVYGSLLIDGYVSNLVFDTIEDLMELVDNKIEHYDNGDEDGGGELLELLKIKERLSLLI